MLRLHFPLDFERMNVAADELLHFTDFTSFSKLHTDVKTNNCRVTEAYWRPGAEPGQWIFTITADRFLRNMVRAVVEAKDRGRAGSSAPGHALYLEAVGYPEELYLD